MIGPQSFPSREFTFFYLAAVGEEEGAGADMDLIPKCKFSMRSTLFQWGRVKSGLKSKV